MDFLSLTWWRNIYAKGGRVFAIGCAFVFAAPIVITAGFNLRQHPGQNDLAQGGTICTVNSQPVTQRDLAWLGSENLGGAPGRAHASAYGGAIYSLVVHKVIDQLAKKLNVHAKDADVDRAIAKTRESKLGANATDAEWENYLSDRMHATSAEFREYMIGQADVQALLDHYKAAEKVTDEEARNLNSEVKLATVFISTGPSANNPKAKPLSDAEAQKKASDLHAQAAAGGDIVAIVKANSADMQAKSPTPGVSDWRGEYQKGSQETPFGALFYGSEFDKVVQKAAKGQLTDVVKASGFMNGYIFAKVMDRRVNLPKDFDVKKEIATLQEQRGYKKLDAEIKAAVKAAKVVFPAEMADKQAYYDYARLDVMQQEMRGAMGMPGPDAPSQAEFKAQEDLIEADFEKALKAHPDDTTATLMVASNLEAKRMTAPPAEQGALRDRIITLYESAFKTTEDIDKRFALAEMYHDKHDDKSTFKQYGNIIKLLNSDPSYDLNTRRKELGFRNRLLPGLKGLPAADVPEAAAAITEQETKIADLQVRISIDEAKQKEEQAKQAELQKAAAAAEAAKKKTATPAIVPGIVPPVKPGGAPAVAPTNAPVAPAGKKP